MDELVKQDDEAKNGTNLANGEALENEPVSNGRRFHSPFERVEIEPWADEVDLGLLLNDLVRTLARFVVLPNWAAETLALWIVHTFAFQLREVTTYIGIESPEHRCGKSTLLTVLSELSNRSVVASNVSSPALFRVIEELRPTLLIDEVDTFLGGNEEMRGILNAGYTRKTAYVLRVVNDTGRREGAGEEQSGGRKEAKGGSLASFSCWCPKVISRIGRLPVTLADRCIVFRMQRKSKQERCERMRKLEAEPLRRQCARFVKDHAK
jgi:putative DNA primase/helicase